MRSVIIGGVVRPSLPTRTPCRLLLALAVLAIAMVAPGTARAVDCPAIMAVDDVTVGMTGTGWTVAQGRTRVPFDVEILGVAHGGIGAGRDLIIVEVDSPEIDDAGGIWAGMSGSPVYVGGELLGSVSYGFSFGPSKIGGVTPAEDMIDLLGLPSLAPSASRATASTAHLDGALARTVANRSGATVAEASSLTQLRVPLSISGLSSPSMKLLMANFKNRRSDDVIPYPGTSVDRHAVDVGDPVEAGDSFASVISYGDATAAAIGTVTYVCDGQALAFGHPFLFGGPVEFGANAATAFAVVPDAVYGSFKFAEIAEPLGIVDQDRLAGLRVSLGGTPEAIPIRTVINVPELGRRHEGLTEVALNEWGGYLTFVSLLAGMDSTFDSSGSGGDFGGRGTANLWWTFEGTRGDGTPWKLERGNRYTSRSSILEQVAFEPAIMLDSLIWNDSEQIKVTSAKVAVTAEKAVRLYTIKDVLVGTGNGKLRARGRLAVHRGSKIHVRVILKQFEGGTKTLRYTFRMPNNQRPRGTLVFASAGYLEEGYFPYGEDFDSQLDFFQHFPRNDQLTGGIIRHRQLESIRKTRLDGVVRGIRLVVLFPDGTASPSFGFRAP
jgi:hypothetical protein